MIINHLACFLLSCAPPSTDPTVPPSLFLNIHHPSVSPLPSPQQQDRQYQDYGLSMQVNVSICTYGIKMNNWQSRLPRHTETFTDTNTRRNTPVCQAPGECWPQHQDELGVGDWRWAFKFWNLGMYPLPCWYLFPLNKVFTLPLWFLPESGGIKFGRQFCQICHSGGVGEEADMSRDVVACDLGPT